MSRAQPVQLVANVILEPHVRVLLVRHAPVDEKHVESLFKQELDQRAARRRSKICGRLIIANTSNNGQRATAARSGSGIASSRGGPDHLARSDANGGVVGRQEHVGQLEQLRRRGGDALDHAHGWLTPFRRESLLAVSALASWSAAPPLLQDALELVSVRCS